MSKLSILVVSGGLGSSGGQLVRTALAQFLNNGVTVTVIPHVRSGEQVVEVIAQALATNGIIVHTLVDEALRQQLVALACTRGVVELDLIGSLLETLSSGLEQKPVGKPGLYHKMREQDLKRIEAIEFAVNHDDGKRAHELAQAEIVLIGVSRVGKTPLSMYLSTMGWKVANVPLVKSIQPPSTLFEIDHRRVIGLTIEPGQLVAFRKRRGHNIGLATSSAYMAPGGLIDELEFAQELFRRGRFTTVDTTDKPIEESADEIVVRVERELNNSSD